MMKIPLYLNGTSGDLQDIPKDTSVAIMTGTYDPIHYGHVDAAARTLEYAQQLSGSGVELVLATPHSFSPGKSPAPLEARIKILRAMLNPKVRIGILDCSQVDGRGIGVRQFFMGLLQYHQLQYSRIIGSDRVPNALQELSELRYFVDPREEALPELPPNFFALPPSAHPLVSSTQIRNGEVELGEDYAPVMHLLGQYYPRARIRRRC